MKKHATIKIILGLGISFLVVYSPALASKINLRSSHQTHTVQIDPIKKRIDLKSDPRISQLPPQQQIQALAQKYNLEIKDSTLSQQQIQLARFLLEKAAEKYGVPHSIALALSGYESAGWQMWRKNALPQQNINYTGKHIHSTDWGLMQVNDKAHPQAFPQAQHDMVFNITYGLKYLADLHAQINGSMNLGFGDWDKTLAAYHLGHAPTPSEVAYASSYIQRIRDYAIEHQLITKLRYTIQRGENLGIIAENKLGAFSRWPELLILNPELKNNPEAIRAGQDLLVPVS